jgi:hypothetical protein
MADVRDLVVIHERDFQKYSVDRRIYCVPVCVTSRYNAHPSTGEQRAR